MLPSIFGEDLFDDWMNDYFPFGRDFDKEFSKALAPTERALYGKHAKNMMKTDVRETDGFIRSRYGSPRIQER